MVFVGRSLFDSDGQDWVVYHTGRPRTTPAKSASTPRHAAAASRGTLAAGRRQCGGSSVCSGCTPVAPARASRMTSWRRASRGSMRTGRVSSPLIGAAALLATPSRRRAGAGRGVAPRSRSRPARPSRRRDAPYLFRRSGTSRRRTSASTRCATRSRSSRRPTGRPQFGTDAPARSAAGRPRSSNDSRRATPAALLARGFVRGQISHEYRQARAASRDQAQTAQRVRSTSARSRRSPC